MRTVVLLFVVGFAWFEFYSPSLAFGWATPVEYEFEVVHVPEVGRAIVKFRKKNTGNFLSANVKFEMFSCGAKCVRTCDVSVNKSAKATEVFRNLIPQKFIVKSPPGRSASGAILRGGIRWDRTVTTNVPIAVWLPPNVLENALKSLKRSGLYCGYSAE